MNSRTLLLVALVGLAACSPAPAPKIKGSVVSVGDIAPAFTLKTTDGAEISTEKLRGKVILVNFFATWCPPCLAELPHLEREVWHKFKDRGLNLVVVGREHDADEVMKFKASKGFTMPFAADPKRETFARYATEFIPRNVLIGGDGTIAFQSVGFDEAEFAEMVRTIERELKKVK